MATLAQKIRCEQHAREMLQSEGLPQPDWIEYGHACIRLFWEKSKVVLVVDIDTPPEGFDPVDQHLDDLDGDHKDEGAGDLDYDKAAAELERLDIGGGTGDEPMD
jgi:hypothetical protein